MEKSQTHRPNSSIWILEELARKYFFSFLTQYRHQGPCWQVTWAHPKYESVIATCGYDRQIKIWKEDNFAQWKCVFKVET